MSSSTTRGDDRVGVQVVQRVARILNALNGQPSGLSLAQIAKEVDLARSTVHRLIAALETERFVVSASPNGRFRLGPALATLGLAAQRDIALEIRPFLVRLSRQVQETVDLAVLEHDHVLFVDQVAAPRRLRAVSAVGSMFPVHCTANGKAMLAGLPLDEVLRLLPMELEPLTPNTITDRDRLLEDLEEVRRAGIAYDREEHTIGICAVGTVISVPDAPIAAVTVPLPVQRFLGNEQQLAGALTETRSQIEHALAERKHRSAAIRT